MTITDPTGWVLPTSLPVELPLPQPQRTRRPAYPCSPVYRAGSGPSPSTDSKTPRLISIRSVHGGSDSQQRISASPPGIFVNVLDIDVHATGTGFPILRTLHQEGLIAGWGQAVRSPSGGLHLYYPATAGRELSSWSRGRTHVDFRGVGGYIIAPPSTITTEHGNRRYELIARGKQPRPVDADRIREFLTPKPDPSARKHLHSHHDRGRRRWSTSQDGYLRLRKGTETQACSGRPAAWQKQDSLSTTPSGSSNPQLHLWGLGCVRLPRRFVPPTAAPSSPTTPAALLGRE